MFLLFGMDCSVYVPHAHKLNLILTLKMVHKHVTNLKMDDKMDFFMWILV